MGGQVDPAALAQAQLDAYNAHDLEAFCACYAEDVTVAELDGTVTVRGLEALRERYRALFAEHPLNRADLVARMVVGGVVIDHERIWRAPDAAPFEAAAIYTVRGAHIARVVFIKA